MTDVSVTVLNDNLPAASQVGSSNEFYVLADTKFWRVSFAHNVPPFDVSKPFYQAGGAAVKRL